MHAAAGRAGRREQVRFVSVSQFGAGAFLNAIPTRAHFRLPSYVLRFALQRRYGLHLSMMTDVMADGIYSQHGLPFDALGDVAQNDGAAGHQTRHKEVLLDLVELLRGKLGRGAVEHEFHCEHSTTRTDLYIYQGVIGDLPCIGDTKIFAGVPSDPSGVGRMGAFVACSKERTPDRMRGRHTDWLAAVAKARAKRAAGDDGSSAATSAEARRRAKVSSDAARKAAFHARGSQYFISSPGVRYSYEWLRPWANHPRLLAQLDTVRRRRPPKRARREYYGMLYHGATLLRDHINTPDAGLYVAFQIPVSYTHLTLPTICSV